MASWLRQMILALLIIGLPIYLFAQAQFRLDTGGLPLSTKSRQGLKSAIEQHRFQAAENLLVEEVVNQSGQSKLLALLGEIYFLDRKFFDCSIAMSKADRMAPLADDQRFTLAMALLAMKRPDWARPELERLRATDRRNASYVYWLGKLDFDDQKLPVATEEFREAIRLDPGFVKAYDMLGVASQAAGKADEAEKYFIVAVRLNRQAAECSPWPPLDFGSMLLEQGRFGESELYLRDAARIDPGLSKAHYKLASLLEHESRNDEAIREFRTAATLDPADPAPWYAIARVYRRAGRETEAEQAGRKFRLLASGTAQSLSDSSVQSVSRP